MKKYFVLALALMAFAVAPVMADVALSGEFVYSAAWDTSDSVFAGKYDKLELDLTATLDDYNTFKLELEDDGADSTVWNSDPDDDPLTDDAAAEDDGKPAILDEALTVNYAKVITDWGKYFGFAESGFGMTTTTGLFDVESKETADFTGYNLEYGYTDLGTSSAIMADFDIMGMVNVYYGQKFDTYSDDKGFLFGAQASIDPVTVEVYYKALGQDPAIDNAFGIEAAYSGEVTDGVVLNAAGHLQMVYGGFPGDGVFGDAASAAAGMEEFNTQYGFGIGAEAYGATVNLSFTGCFLGSDADEAAGEPSLAFSMLGIDAEYSILEWLSINGGFLMNMGDYAELAANDESFSGAEFGVSIMPGAVTYKLGYVAANEDAGNYITIQPEAIPAKGGLYFVVDLDY